MSFLLAQILVCLLIAGLIGAIIGWFLRGNCSNAVKKCEEEWRLRLGALESDYAKSSTNHHYSPEQATLKKESQPVNNSSQANNFNNLKQLFSQRGIKLDDHKIELYSKLDEIDFAKAPDLQDSYPLEKLAGIEPQEIKALQSLGINTTKELTQKIKNATDIKQIAGGIQITPEKLRSFVGMSDLLKLPLMDSKGSKLLQTIGISSLSELAASRPETLHNELEKFTKKTGTQTTIPSVRVLTLWTKIAKALS